MHIVIVSNYLNHHQLPWIESLKTHEDVTVYFVSTIPTPQTRLSFGYSNYETIEYNLHYYDLLQKEKIQELVAQADVVLMGGTRVNELIELRLSTKKLLLFYSERWHKRRRSYFAIPIRLLTGYIYRQFIRYNKENCYMLCNGAYVANDCYCDFSFKNKTFKWGYFPPYSTLNIDEILEERKSKSTVELIWVARFLKVKKPFLAVKAVERLYKEGYDIRLTMVGGVYKEDKSSEKIHKEVNDYIHSRHLESVICLTGVMTHEKVQDLMRKSDVFLFTSDRGEGWGAVLNEAMSNGCVPVSSHLIGATLFLIKQKENGVIFKSGSLDSLVKSLKYLLNHKDIMLSMRKKAYRTIHEEWSPEVAASNFLKLCESLLKNEETSIKNGPCSIASPSRFVNFI